MLNEPPPQNKARVEVVRVADLETDGRFVRLDLSSPVQGGRAFAGQFFEVSACAFGKGENPRESSRSPLLNRPFSIHRWIDGGFSILFETIGTGTRRLASLHPGDSVQAIGPLGQGMERIPGDVDRLILVAGGIGVAPFVAFAQLAHRQDVPCYLYYGFNRERDLALHRQGSALHSCSLLAEFDTLDCRWFIASMLDNSFFPGTVLDLLNRDWNRGHPAFDTMHGSPLLIACGPWAMLRSLAAWTLQKELRCFVLLEEMMGCGIGICRSCVVPGFDIDENSCRIPRNLAVCRDGPLIAAERIDWERGWA